MMHTGKNVEDVVDSQIRRWQSERKAKAEEKKSQAATQPVITVSREFGARGAEIGREVARALGFGIWDHEIVHAIAEKSGAREALLDTLDEHARGAMEELLATLRGQDDEALAYAKQLGGVIRSVAHHGAAVVVGRGGQFTRRWSAVYRSERVIHALSCALRFTKTRFSCMSKDA